MKKRTKIAACLFAALFVTGWLLWRFLPVHFLRGLEPEEIAAIEVEDGNTGNWFEITDSDDIAGLIRGIQQITFRKKEIASGIPRWYSLTFLDENGEETETIGIQNRRSIRKDMTQKTGVFFFCDGALDGIGDELERLESARFPDYDRDPDASDHEIRDGETEPRQTPEQE